MRKSFAYLSLIAIVVSSSDASAEALNEEVIYHRSLLMLGDVGQAASLSYGYTSHTSMGRSSSSQELSESYGLSTQAAILDPNIFLMQLSGGVSYQQQLENSASKLLNYHYNIVGNAFQLSWHPVLLSNTRTTSQVSNGYTPTYTLERTGNRVSASLLHKIVPVRLFYSHSTVSTSGLAVDTQGTSDTAGLSLQYSQGDRSSTEGSLSYDSTSSGGRESRSYSVFLLNRLFLDGDKRYQLLTKGAFADSISADIPQRQYSISGALSARLGNALTGTLSDQYSYSSTLNFDHEEQSVKTNAVSVGLSHRLYQSVTSAVSASFGKTRTLNGEETSYNSNATVAYRKMLPSNSTLALSANIGHTVTNQDFQTAEPLAVRDEAHEVNQPLGVSFSLNTPGTIVAVESVERVEIVDNVAIRTPYQEGTHWRLDTTSNRIEIVDNMIPPGSTIYISYAVETNQDLDFKSDTQNYLGILSFYGGRYTVTADVSVSNQQRISGEVQNQALVDSTAMNLRGDAHYANSSFGLEYGTVSSTQENLWRAGATWTYDTYLYGNDTIRLSARDVFASYDASATSRAYQENLATLSASYNRPLYSWLRLAIASTVNDSRRQGNSSNMFMFRAGLDGNYNRMNISLSGQTSYRLAQGNDTRDDSFNFKITRYF